MPDAGPERVPVSVLTGFLGSGKTTLLNALLRRPEAGRLAVIVNEIGQVGVDHLLVERIAEDVVLLGGGCVCCSVRGDLLTALDGLLARRATGAVPAFDRVVLETTGLADPAPVLHALAGATGPIRPGAVVTVVDALEGARELRQHREAARQVALADRLVLSKSDLATSEALAALEDSLRAINPAAPLVRSTMGSVAAGVVLDPAPAPWLASRPLGGEDLTVVPPARHAEGVRAFAVIRSQPFPRATLGLWLTRVLQVAGERVLRVKGIVEVTGASGPLVVNAVQQRLYPMGRLDAWPSVDRRSRIVFIGGAGLERDVNGLLEALESEASAGPGRGFGT